MGRGRRFRRCLIASAVCAASAPWLPARGVPLPVLSKNVELLLTIPDVAGISAAFDPSRPLMYVSTLHGIDTYDVSNPEEPVPLSVLPLVVYQNENVNLGPAATRPDGTSFLLVGTDIGGAVTPTSPASSAVAPDDGEYVRHLYVVDVTDPAAPFIRSDLATTTYTHTVSCMDPSCTTAYTAGDMERFSVIDLRDLDAPVEVGTVADTWGWHDWETDAAGVAWKAGDHGSVAYDITDPLRPAVLNSTGEAALSGEEWNDFIHHNSLRPYARRFPLGASDPGRDPSVFAGNVLLVAEENLSPGACTDEAAFQTWHIPSLRAGDTVGNRPGGGSIRPLDLWQSELYDTGQTSPVGADCSAHYFDFHQDGFVAQSWYQHGVRILDVRDPADIKQVGYFVLDVQETWSSYWVPQRDAQGRVAVGDDGQPLRTEIVYSVDAVRGLDVLRVTLPDSAPRSTAALRAPVLPSWVREAPADPPSAFPAATCRIPSSARLASVP